MIDLRSIARHLRLPVEQIRLAADLLIQGYQPAFIERYRADETGCLSHSVLWSLKLAIEKQQRLEASRERALAQLPEGVELDSEAKERLAQAETEIEIDSTMRAFRARRTMQQNAERESAAGQLLEKLLAYSGGPIDDIVAWTKEQLACETDVAEQTLQGCKRLIGTLIAGDSSITKRLRTIIQRRASVKVVLTTEQNKADGKAAGDASATDTAALGRVVAPLVTDAHDADSADTDAHDDADAHLDEAYGDDVHVEGAEEESVGVDAVADEGAADDENAEEAADAIASQVVDGEASAECAAEPTASESTQSASSGVVASEPGPLAFATGGAAKGSIAKKGKRKKGKDPKLTAKNAAKISPRQRRRRWLISMLQPFNGLDKPLAKLSAYQQLMIGRGRRSQLVNLHLSYDARLLAEVVRDAFVNDKHPLLSWFNTAIEDAMSRSMVNRVEQDAIAELEELAQQNLLEVATDSLRDQLQQRPVRGHRILVIDAVGPKTSSVAIVDPKGRVLHTDEITCSAQPQVVTQNVTRLGELVHRFKVTLVALTNGPARRFLVHTLRELVGQSADSGLHWTMIDRGGAEAYAASRIALQELPEHNRRDRATIWIARRLQDPLCEMVKLDPSRLRLGSFQRELPAESLKKLVNETIADCVCARGIDVLSANMQELMMVPGISRSEAEQILKAAALGKINSREEVLSAVPGWSELQSRQAIGFLRVFGSSNTLDATAIHPEDYKLAERLIQGTELQQPPAAPAGWTKPTPAASESAAKPTAVAEAVVTDAVTPAAESVDGGADATAQSATEVAAESTTETVTAAAGDSASEPTNEVAAESVAEESASSDQVADSSPSAVAQEPAAESTVAPEYSADVAPPSAQTLAIDVEKLARGWQVGREKLRWVATCLQEPFADSRLSRPPVPMQKAMPTLENLQPGTCFWVVVVGVADFGAFVELGPECSGLIHISRLSPNFIEDPHQCVQVGDLLQAWVVNVDQKKRRVAMTAISPAQREAMDREEAQRAAQRAAERAESNQRGGRPDRGQGRGPSQGGQGQQRGGQGFAGQGGQGFGGQGQRQSSGQGNQSGNFAGAGSGGGRGRDGGRGQGGGGRGQQRGGPRGGDRGREGGRGGASQPIIVTSKKPKAPITKEMAEGNAPLRSFSDLLQFYEHKRTDPPAVDVPAPTAESQEKAEQTPGATE